MLGAPYRPLKEHQPFQAALRDRFTDHNPTLGLPAYAAAPARERARIGGEMAAEWFLRKEGDAAGSELELQSALVPWSRSAPAAVGGMT